LPASSATVHYYDITDYCVGLHCRDITKYCVDSDETQQYIMTADSRKHLLSFISCTDNIDNCQPSSESLIAISFVSCSCHYGRTMYEHLHQ